jgi:Dullard-like phosphatase family protein
MSNNPQSKKQKNSKLLSLEERVITFLEYSNHLNQKQTFKNGFQTIKDNLIPLKIESSSSLSTQTQKEEKKCIINIDKKILKFAEPRFKILPTPFLQPKFSRYSDLSSSITSILKHNITESMTDLLETDEKISMNKMEQIEKKKNIIEIGNNFPYRLLKEHEKIYEEILKDLKGNGFNNIKYKGKIATNYLTILLHNENTIGTIFYHNKDINQFFIRELCIFLCILFLDDFKGLSENELTDYKNCLIYCHLNFLYVMMIIINHTEEKNINIEIDKNNYFAFESCKNILNAVDEKIDEEKFKNNLHGQNKIIKNILLNLINNLSYLNSKVTEEIKTIFKLAKNTKLNDVIITHIQGNNLITEKVNLISLNDFPENSNSKSDNKNNEENQKQNKIEEVKKPVVPYISKKNPKDKREYTLVLDLDETLVHYYEDTEEENAYVKVRLGTENFIKKLSQYCEIGIFTASTEDYANIVIDGLDCSDKIDFRLYRQHTSLECGFNVKDLSKLGRDLSKIIIIDNIEENYCLQPENGLNIIDFEGDESDHELNFLLEDLLQIVKEKNKDIRDLLPEVRKKMQKRYMNIIS